MTKNTKEDVDKSLFVFVKDVNTGRIKRLAVPCDLQVGITDNPSELQLLGRFSVATKEYVVNGTNNGVILVSNHDSIVSIFVESVPSSGRTSVYLPSSPRNGQLIIIKDAEGNATTTPIDIFASGNSLIDQVSSKTLTTNYDSIFLYWFKNTWNVISHTQNSASVNSSGSDVSASYITVNNTGSLPNERQLLAGTNITLTDTGPGGSITIDAASSGGSSGSVWIDGGNKAKTTSSISIDSQSRYATELGTDVYFFLSGTIAGASGSLSSPKVSLFGGDVIVSGSTRYPQSVAIPGLSPSWVLTSSLSQATAATATFVIGDSVFFVGGLTGSVSGLVSTHVSVASLKNWGSSFNTFSGAIQIPWARGTPAIIGDKAYIFGGTSGSGGTNGSTYIFSASVYNMTGVNAWSRLTPAAGGSPQLAAAVLHSSCAIIGSYIYLFGGENPYNTRIATIQRAPISDPTSWESVGNLSAVNSRSPCAVIDDSIYLFGGKLAGGAIYKASTSDPTSWVTTNVTLPAGRAGGQTASNLLAIVGNKIIWPGGYDEADNQVRTVYYALLSDPLRWFSLGDIIPASIAPECVVVGDNNTLLILGGYNSLDVNLPGILCYRSYAPISASLISGLQPNSGSSAVVTNSGDVIALTSWQRLNGMPPWLVKNVKPY